MVCWSPPTSCGNLEAGSVPQWQMVQFQLFLETCISLWLPKVSIPFMPLKAVQQHETIHGGPEKSHYRAGVFLGSGAILGSGAAKI